MTSPDVTEDWLKSLLQYFDEIIEQYPLRLFSTKSHKVENADQMLIISDGWRGVVRSIHKKWRG